MQGQRKVFSSRDFDQKCLVGQNRVDGGGGKLVVQLLHPLRHKRTDFVLRVKISRLAFKNAGLEAQSSEVPSGRSKS